MQRNPNPDFVSGWAPASLRHLRRRTRLGGEAEAAGSIAQAAGWNDDVADAPRQLL